MKMHESQRLINHVALVLDRSGSMSNHAKNVVKVADEQIINLMRKSEELKQETRVSIYSFGSSVDCLIFDMDVLHLPSIEDLYKIHGCTLLYDAYAKSQLDLGSTSQIYGDHSFLTLVITDGEDTDSKLSGFDVGKMVGSAPENWTTGFLVPGKNSLTLLKRYGVPENSIFIWDAADAQGMLDVGRKLTDVTTSYMTARSQGVRGTKSLFVQAPTDAAHVNAKTVAKTCKPMDRSSYSLHDVKQRQQIGDFVNDTLKMGPYYVGKGFYQFMKPETIQGDKAIVVVNKHTGQAYEGVNARSLIGLTPNVEAKVKPADNPDFDIFVQSKAINRNLIPGTKMLLMK